MDLSKDYLPIMPIEIHPYANAIKILELETEIAEYLYEDSREGCLKDKDRAGRAQIAYELACEYRHAANVLRNSKPSGIMG